MIRLVALGLLLGLIGPSPADARRRRVKGPPSGGHLAAESLKAPLREAIQDALRSASGRAGLVLDRFWPVADARRGKPGVALVTALAPGEPGGVVGLLSVPRGKRAAPALLEHVYLPRLRGHRWDRRPLLDVDGDRRSDLILPWSETHRGLTRDGVIIVRTAPASMHRMELGTTFKGNATRVPVACFVPLLGERARMLALHQIADGQHGFELLEPAPNGGWRPFAVYTAALAQERPEGEAVEIYWKALGARRARRRRTAPDQATLGACPGEGILVPSRLVGGAQAPGWAVLGPFARSSGAVRARLKRRRSARAALIIQLGAATAP